MPFFLYATLSRDRIILESSVGPCTFCSTPGSIDIVEQRSITNFFGLWPFESKDRLACCNECGRSIKEIHYNFRQKPKPTQSGTQILVDNNNDNHENSNAIVVNPVHVIAQPNNDNHGDGDDTPVVVQAVDENDLTTSSTTEEGGNSSIPAVEGNRIL